MTIASALDKLNDKLAGSDQQASQTIEGMILRIIDNIDNIGGGGGGGGALIVHPDADDDTKLDKTAGEIMAAAQAGYVAFCASGSGAEVVSPLVAAMSASGIYMFTFSGVDNGSIELMTCTATSADGKPEIAH